ncbi:MAG: hypothetical protein CM1200mP4_5570 [Rhodospirillaceae bacterium]|nr:MAG: hypothetical protein CM1200mP4_5570 [Rhodospirillaceae bacterium]
MAEKLIQRKKAFGAVAVSLGFLLLLAVKFLVIRAPGLQSRFDG